MKHTKLFILGTLCVVLLANALTLEPSTDLKDSVSNEPSKLVVVWTSGDREVALKMVYMYTYNAKKNGWWDNIRLIVWGPSSKLLSEDKELQDYTQKMKEVGVEVFACKACADMYGISEKLEELGLEVKYIGEDLTEMLQSGWTHLTF
ncbi:MAG: DsrE family protein [Candidatus Aminicenantaceae bacterium]